MQPSGYGLLRTPLLSRQVNKRARRENVGSSHPERATTQPYISADTTRYNASAHVPISAAPTSHSTPNTKAHGISKNRLKALLSLRLDNGAAEEDFGAGGLSVVLVIVGVVLTKTSSSPIDTT